MLDQVALSRAVFAGVGHQATHSIQLMVAREDQGASTCLPVLVVLLLDLVNELAHEIQYAVPRPDALPQVGCRVTLLRGRHRRIARSAELALIEGKEARLRARELRGDVDQFRVHRKVGQASAVGQERLAGIAVAFVLLDGVLNVLSGKRVLEFGGEERQAVQEDPEVQAVLVPLAVVKLPHHREEVALVEALEFLVEAAGRTEVRQSEFAAGVPDAVPQHVQRAAPLDLAGQPLEEALLDLGPVVLLEPLPRLRLGGEDEVEDVARDQAPRAVVVVRRAAEVAAGRAKGDVGREDLAYPGGFTGHSVRVDGDQGLLDGCFEGALGDVGHARLLLWGIRMSSCEIGTPVRPKRRSSRFGTKWRTVSRPSVGRTLA